MYKYFTYDPTSPTSFVHTYTKSAKAIQGEKAGRVAVKNGRNCIELTIDKKVYSGPRVAWAIHFNKGVMPPDTHVVVCVNGNTLDLSPTNLRLMTRSQRAYHRNLLKGINSIHQTKCGNWVARTTMNYKSICLGTHATKEEAITAYRAHIITQLI